MPFLLPCIPIYGNIVIMVIAGWHVAEEFSKKNSQARKPLLRWYTVVSKAHWKSFADVPDTFSSADLFGECAVFNVGGNNYRLIARIDYVNGIVLVVRVMTHNEYNKDTWKKDC